MREKLLKRLHQIIIEIVRANDVELDKIGVELAEIEKELLKYAPNKKYTNTK